jgi:hypothetical protein
LVTVALLPEMVTATAVPPTARVAPAETDPVCPAAVPKVCAVEFVPEVTVKFVAEAVPATRVRTTAKGNEVFDMDE